MTGRYLYKRKEREIWTQTHREGHVKMEAETGVWHLQPADAWSHPHLKEVRKGLLLQVPRDHSPADAP